MKRLIPTDKEWFNYKENKHCALLFSFIASSATFYNNRLYYTKKQYVKDIPLLKKYTELSTKKSIDKYINKLIELGYLTDDKENYYPINRTDSTYLLIDRDLLYNICTTRSSLSIQIFIYLMDRMNMKQEQYKENTYNFTIKELKSILGFSPLSQNYKIEQAIIECLQTFKVEKYIDYKQIYVSIDNSKGEYKAPNYLLTFVCNKIPNNLQEVKKEEAETAQHENNNKDFIF